MPSEVHHSYINSSNGSTTSSMAQATPSMSTASTSTAQANSARSQHEFLFNTPTSHSTEELDTPTFMQQMARRIFPHASIPYNYSSGNITPVVSSPNHSGGQSYEEEVEGEGEVNYSQP